MPFRLPRIPGFEERTDRGYAGDFDDDLNDWSPPDLVREPEDDRGYEGTFDDIAPLTPRRRQTPVLDREEDTLRAQLARKRGQGQGTRPRFFDENEAALEALRASSNNPLTLFDRAGDRVLGPIQRTAADIAERGGRVAGAVAFAPQELTARVLEEEAGIDLPRPSELFGAGSRLAAQAIVPGSTEDVLFEVAAPVAGKAVGAVAPRVLDAAGRLRAAHEVPEVLYHWTPSRNVAGIMDEGLRPGSFLAATPEAAQRQARLLGSAEEGTLLEFSPSTGEVRPSRTTLTRQSSFQANEAISPSSTVGTTAPSGPSARVAEAAQRLAAMGDELENPLLAARKALLEGETGAVRIPGGTPEEPLSDLERLMQQSVDMAKADPDAAKAAFKANAEKMAGEIAAEQKLKSGFYRDTGHVRKRAAELAARMDEAEPGNLLDKVRKATKIVNDETGALRVPGETPTPGPMQGSLEGGALPVDRAGEVVRDKRPGSFVSNVLNEAQGLAGAPLALKTTISPSLLRQGMARLITNPKAALGEAYKSIVAAARETDARAFQKALLDQETSSRYAANGVKSNFKGLTADEAGLKIRDWGSAAPKEARSPEFQGLNQSKIGKFVSGDTKGQVSGKLGGYLRFSERQYALESNAHALGRYGEVAQRMADAGITDPQSYKDLAAIINHQAHFGDWQQGKIPVFFSTRAISGRAQAIADLTRVFTDPKGLLTPGATQEAAKGMIGMVAANTALMYAVAEALPGFDIEMKSGVPLLKTPVGRIDPYAGWSTLAKLIYDTGDIMASAAEGDEPDEIKTKLVDRAARFLRGQQSPAASEATTFLTGKDSLDRPVSLGEQFNPKDLAVRMAAPMLAESIYEGYSNYGVAGAVAGAGIEGLSGSINQQPNRSDYRNEEAAKRGFKTFDEIEDYGVREEIDKAIEGKGLQFPPSKAQVAGEAAKAEIDEQLGKVEAAFKAGQLDPSKSLGDRYGDIGAERAGRGKVLEAFWEQENIKPTSKYAKKIDELLGDEEDGDGYYGLSSQFTDEFGQLDYPKLKEAQKQFIENLPAKDRQIMESYLKYTNSLKTDLQQRRDKMYTAKEAAGYYAPGPAGETLKARGERLAALAKDLDKKNPDLDVEGWYFSGGRKEGIHTSALQSSEAVDKALALINSEGLKGRVVKHEDLTRPINQDENSLAAWEATKKMLNGYENLKASPSLRNAEAQRLYDKPYDKLTKEQQGTVTGNLGKLAKQSVPDLDGVLRWWSGDPPSTVEELASWRKMADKYGKKPAKAPVSQ